MIRYRTFLILVVAMLPISGELSAKDGPIAADHPLLALLTASDVAQGRQHRALLVYPIVAQAKDPDNAPRAMTAAEAYAGEHLSMGEPGKSPGRGALDAFNWSKKPILLLGGEVFEGGIRDRFVRRDVLLAPGQKTTVPVHPADKSARTKAEAMNSLAPKGALAPDLLRQTGLLDAGPSAGATFLEDAFALAGVRHPRWALPFLLDAEKLRARMRDYVNIFEVVPAEAQHRVIGVAAYVGERLLGIDIFPTNRAFAAHWPTILRTLAFQASLYELSYGLLNQPALGVRDPDRRRTEVKSLLKRCYAARIASSKTPGLGEEIRLSRDDLAGRVLLLDGQVVHGVFVLDYMRNKPDAAVPPGTRPNPESTPSELERRGARSRLTEYEKRLLERMRQRRAPNPRLTPRVPEVPK